MGKQLYTFDGKTVCDVASWPPRQNDTGHWELAVRGDPSIFDLLSDCQGRDFKVGKYEFHNLLFIRREVAPPRDEIEFPTMVFANVEYYVDVRCWAYRIGDRCRGRCNG